MNTIIRRGAFAIGLALALAGCGGGTDAGTGASQQASESPAIQKDARYGTVDELKDAAVEAGYDCPNWQRTNKVELAAQSGTCSEDDVFSTYSSETSLQQQLESYRGMDEVFEDAGLDAGTRLVGPNWIINSEKAEDLQKQLGGTVEGGS